MLALCGSLCCLIAFTMSTLCLGKGQSIFKIIYTVADCFYFIRDPFTQFNKFYPLQARRVFRIRTSRRAFVFQYKTGQASRSRQPRKLAESSAYSLWLLGLIINLEAFAQNNLQKEWPIILINYEAHQRCSLYSYDVSNINSKGFNYKKEFTARQLNEFLNTVFRSIRRP